MQLREDPTTIFIPAGLQKNILDFGPEGSRWLDGLPEQIAKIEREWDLRVGQAFDHSGAVSWVAPVERGDGSEAVLKIGIPHFEARFEGDALRLLNGEGAVKLLDVSDDGFSMLIERCVPGTDLWSLSETEGDAVAAGILRRFWRELEPDAPFRSLADTIDRWRQEKPHRAAHNRYDRKQVDRALELGRELAAGQPRNVLLHGDFHPGNVLAAERESWLAIDPKPLAGDPAYDLAQWLFNRYPAAALTSDPVSTVRKQIDYFAKDLGLSPSRIAGWAVVKAVGWDYGAEVFSLFQSVAEEL